MALSPQMFLSTELSGVEFPEELDFAEADGTITRQDEAALLEFLKEFEDDDAASVVSGLSLASGMEQDE